MSIEILEKRERGRIQGLSKFFGYPLLSQEWVKLHTSNLAFPKLYARYHPCLAVLRLEKFHEDIHTSPEALGVNTLNFRSDF